MATLPKIIGNRYASRLLVVPLLSPVNRLIAVLKLLSRLSPNRLLKQAAAFLEQRICVTTQHPVEVA